MARSRPRPARWSARSRAAAAWGGRPAGGPAAFPRGRVRLLVAVAAVVATATLALHTRGFLLGQLTVSGMRQVTQAEVYADLGLPPRTYAWQVRPWVAEARLERDPLIASARVRVRWPDGLDVALSERVPAALVVDGQRAWEVDAGGLLLRALPDPGGSARVTVPGIGSGVPAIVGARLTDPVPGRVAGAPALGAALAVATHLGGAFPDPLAEVRIAADGTVGVLTTGGVAVSYGDGQDASAKTALLLGALARFRQTGTRVSSCDFSSTVTPACTTSAGTTPVSAVATAG